MMRKLQEIVSKNKASKINVRLEKYIQSLLKLKSNITRFANINNFIRVAHSYCKSAYSFAKNLGVPKVRLKY